jgi:hypothetical protein
MAAGSALRKINTRVKHLQRLHPGAKRVTLQRQAGAEYRAGKLGGVSKRKKALKKVKKYHRQEGRALKALGRRPRRRVGATLSDGPRPSSYGIMGFSQHITHAKEKLMQKIEDMYGRIFKAKTKLAKRKLNKKLSELKSKYRKLC